MSFFRRDKMTKNRSPDAPPTAIVPIVIWKNNGEDVLEDITGSLKSGLFHL